jgi:hypothetical protein
MFHRIKALAQKAKLLSPITSNLLLLLVVMYANYLFYKKLALKDNQFLPIIYAMCKIALLFSIVVIIFSLMSTVISYLYFKQQAKVNHLQLQIQFHNSNQLGANKMGLFIRIQKTLIPFMGYIKAVLHYDNHFYTPILNLSSSAQQSGWMIKQIYTSIPLQLVDIKEYQIHDGYLFFEDMLRLFSIPYPFAAQQVFQNQPQLQTVIESSVIPKKTQELEIRIPQMRRVDGDLLHYKKFSTSDDTRRIVWKIFAKNRDLVVRTPEIFNPFASNIYMYASYFASKQLLLDTSLTTQMLNYYKDAVYTIYDVLQQKEFEVNYIADQQIQGSNKVVEKITLSNWQLQTPIHQFVKPNNATVLCIHSLSDPDDLQQVFAELDANTIVYFVKTSQLFLQNNILKTLQRIFILPPKDELEKIRTRWWLSGTRLLVLKNEKRIEAILEKQHVTYTIL